MYNEYFGFKEAPFSIAPDPRYLFMTSQHREALAHLVYGLNSEGGCILLTGEVGTGKTTICRCLLEQIPDHANVALLLNPKVSEIELLETICDELKINYPDANNSVKTYTDRIYQFLIASNRNNEKTVLIIDEAQNLSSKVLEQLRLLTNLETNQRKLLQIIILGQPELLSVLARPEMRQLAQRITARFHLQPLTKSEIKAYVAHRLAVAGQSVQLFPDGSIKLLFKLSNGIPRLINILCDRALLGAYVENQHAVHPSILKKAATEVFGELKNVERQQKNRQWLYPIAALASITSIVVGLSIYTALTSSDDTMQNAQQDSLTTASNAETATLKAHSPLAEKTALPEATSDSINTKAAIPPQELGSNGNIITSQHLSVSETSENHADLNLILADKKSNQVSAYQALFKVWGVHYNHKITTTACTQAKAFSLRCQHKQGNLNSLKANNRPAVLTMVNEQGEQRHITVTSIQDKHATVLSNNTQYVVKLADLDRYWYGQFNFLWRIPEGYSSAITPGDSSNPVKWLKQHFTTSAVSNNPVYNAALIENVKDFQAYHGLVADGIVGPVTIMHLNTVYGLDIPTLRS